jgi:hypothetical protein
VAYSNKTKKQKTVYKKKQPQITEQKQKQKTNLQKNRDNRQTKQKQGILKKLAKGLAICLKACQDLKR